jgi:hypothetical protein
MTTFQSNEEFFSALSGLIDRWCDERRLGQLATLLPGYLALNGLTDGWGELHGALRRLRAFGPESFSGADWELTRDLTMAADDIIDRRGWSSS